MRRMDSSTNRLTVALARGAMASPSSAVALLVLGYLGLHLIDQHLRD